MSTVLLVLVVVALGAIAIFLQTQARQQVSVRSPHSPPQVLQLVRQQFGPTWRDVPGSGDVNFVPRMRKQPPTLSIDIVPSGTGSEVQIWTSEWASKFGIMNHAMLMWRKKRSLAARVAQG